MTRIIDMRGDLQAESSVWVVVQVTTCRGGGILWWPHYRSHRSLLRIFVCFTVVIDYSSIYLFIHSSISLYSLHLMLI